MLRFPESIFNATAVSDWPAGGLAQKQERALPFGLSAYVYLRDLERAWSFAERLQSGAVGINVNDTTELQAPFGGWKLSGLGRELGSEGLMAFREPKHIRMRLRSGSR